MKKRDSSSKMIEEGIEKIAQLYHISENFPDAELKTLITQSLILAKKIYDRLEEKPEYIRQLNMFHNYFMDTISLLIFRYGDIYKNMSSQQIIDTCNKMKILFENLNLSFQKQYDSMYTMDILQFNSEIEVLMKTLKAEHLF